MANIIPATDDRIQDVRQALSGMHSRITELSSSSLDPARFVSVVVQAVQKTPALLQCDKMSLLASVLEAAQLGLTPAGITGEAYLVPRKQQAQLQVGYKGLVKLALESGQVRSIVARPVYQGDAFSFHFGLERDTLQHVPCEDGDPGEVRAAYAIARMADGDPQIEVTMRRDIERARAAGDSGSSFAWAGWYPEMAAKTAVRRLCRLLTLSPKMQRALALDAGEDVGSMSLVPDAPASKPKGKVQAAAARLSKAPEPQPEPQAEEEPEVDWEAIEADQQAQEPQQELEEPKAKRVGSTTLQRIFERAGQHDVDAVTLTVLCQQWGKDKPEDLLLKEANALLKQLDDGSWENQVPF